MPLTSIFKPVTKKKQTDIKWENVLSQSSIQRWKRPCFRVHFSRRLKMGSSKAATNYPSSLSLDNSFSLLFWLYCFRLKSITAVSYRLTSLSLPGSIIDHEKWELCDLHSMVNDPQFQNFLLFISAPLKHVFQKRNVTELMHR